MTSAPRTCASPNCANASRVCPYWRSRPRRRSSWPRISCTISSSRSPTSCAAASHGPTSRTACAIRTTRTGSCSGIARNVPGSGIVYMRTREGTEQIADLLRQEGNPGHGLPRRTGVCRAVAAPGGVAAGEGARHGGDQRFRHGHRQARRAVRGPLRHVRLARKLLSGGRTRRARRETRLCPAACRRGRPRPHRPAFREGVSAARTDQGDIRACLLLPQHRHRRRRRCIVPVQHPRVLRPRASLFGHGGRSPSSSCSRTATSRSPTPRTTRPASSSASAATSCTGSASSATTSTRSSARSCASTTGSSPNSGPSTRANWPPGAGTRPSGCANC